MWKQILGAAVVGFAIASLLIYGLNKEAERFEEHGPLYSENITDL